MARQGRARRSAADGAHRRRALLAAIAAAAAALAVLGCQDPVTGIFHHLAHQLPTVDRGLANDITIGSIARWNGRYVVAAGKLWSRPVGTEQNPGDWNSVAATYDGHAQPAILSTLVRWQPAGGDPSLLAGVQYVRNDGQFRLLQASGDRIRSDAIRWTSVRDTEAGDREVIALFTPDARQAVLFAVVADARGAKRTYRLLSAVERDGDAPDFDVELSALSRPVEAVATDGSGTWWAVAGTKLYTGERGAMKASASAPAPAQAETFRGVFHDGSKTLVLSGSAGTLWRSQDGGATWPDPQKVRADDQTVRLTRVAAVGGTALVGADGFGYYTVALGGDLRADRLPLTTEAIYHASIRSFWVDPETAGTGTVTLFALTAGDGLWYTRVASGARPGRWQLE